MNDDLISRKAAIDALAKFVPYAICDASTESYTNGLTDAYNLICQLPSAQPERKKGGSGFLRLTANSQVAHTGFRVQNARGLFQKSEMAVGTSAHNAVQT